MEPQEEEPQEEAPQEEEPQVEAPQVEVTTRSRVDYPRNEVLHRIFKTLDAREYVKKQYAELSEEDKAKLLKQLKDMDKELYNVSGVSDNLLMLFDDARATMSDLLRELEGVELYPRDKVLRNVFKTLDAREAILQKYKTLNVSDRNDVLHQLQILDGELYDIRGISPGVEMYLSEARDCMTKLLDNLRLVTDSKQETVSTVSVKVPEEEHTQASEAVGFSNNDKNNTHPTSSVANDDVVRLVWRGKRISVKISTFEEKRPDIEKALGAEFLNDPEVKEVFASVGVYYF